MKEKKNRPKFEHNPPRPIYAPSSDIIVQSNKTSQTENIMICRNLLENTVYTFGFFVSNSVGVK